MRHMRKDIMETTRMRVGRFVSHKGTERDNRELLSRLAAHKIADAHWTDHAIGRAQEMVDAGFDFRKIMKAISNPRETYWSPTYEQPCGRYEDVSVGLMADKWGRTIVTTVLPATDSAWQKFYDAGPTKGRARRSKTVDRRKPTTEPMPQNPDDAIGLITDAPFKMRFFLYNEDAIANLFDSDPDARQLFLNAAEKSVNAASRWDNRDKRHADINLHPHLTPAEKKNLLVILHQYGKSIDALSAGLPTLGRKR